MIDPEQKMLDEFHTQVRGVCIQQGILESPTSAPLFPVELGERKTRRRHLLFKSDTRCCCHRMKLEQLRLSKICHPALTIRIDYPRQVVLNEPCGSNSVHVLPAHVLVAREHAFIIL